MGYRKVKKAWVVLDANGNSVLYIAFDEPPAHTVPRSGEGDGPYVFVDVDGMVYYGINEGSQWWSSRAGVINRQFDLEVIDAVESMIPDNFPKMTIDRVCAITKGFVNVILQQFDLPFHYELVEDSETDRRYALVQNDRRSYIGHSVETTPYGLVVITDSVIQSGSPTEIFIVKDSNGQTHKFSYAELPDLYRGITLGRYNKEKYKLLNSETERL